MATPRLNFVPVNDEHTQVFKRIMWSDTHWPREHWGQGLATEAVCALVNHAHDKLNIFRLEAGVFGENAASARVFEMAGFVHEGIKRSGHVHREERRDLWLFGRLESDPRSVWCGVCLPSRVNFHVARRLASGRPSAKLAAR